MQEVATKSKLSIFDMLEKIRENHIDIELIIQEELQVFLSDNLESILYSVYINLTLAGVTLI